MNYIAWPAEFGSRNYMHAITTNTSPGAFICLCKEKAPSAFVVSEEGRAMQSKFWRECVGLWKGLVEELEV